MADLTTIVQDGETVELAYNVVNTSPHVGRQQQVELIAPDGTTVIDSDAILLEAEDSERGVLRTGALTGGQDNGIYEVISEEGSRTVQVYVGVPNSVVSRPDDNNSANNSAGQKLGVKIKSDVEWPIIGGELSSNLSDATMAYVYRVSDGFLMGDVDITGLVSGDTFTIDLDKNIKPYDGSNDTVYNFVVGNETSSWSNGYYDGPSFPYTSVDGQLEIIAGANGDTTETTSTISALKRIGYVGFN